MLIPHIENLKYSMDTKATNSAQFSWCVFWADIPAGICCEIQYREMVLQRREVSLAIEIEHIFPEFPQLICDFVFDARVQATLR
jgi:hypothetical protein